MAERKIHLQVSAPGALHAGLCGIRKNKLGLHTIVWADVNPHKVTCKRCLNKLKGATIRMSELTTLKMTTGGEKRHSIVIIGANVERWVGFGWVTERPATAKDHERYLTVVDSEKELFNGK